MSTLVGRDKTALLVIDVQNDIAAGAFNLQSVVANIGLCVEKARAADVSVIWVQHNDDEIVIDTDGWQIVEQLEPAYGEPIVRKSFRSSFEATNLEEILVGLNVNHLVITGMQTNNCVRHTTHSALERGYDVTLVSDAHTTTGYEWGGHKIEASEVVDETNDNFGAYQLPGRGARAVTVAALSF
jgi:nicotinamidase-related amidase